MNDSSVPHVHDENEDRLLGLVVVVEVLPHVHGYGCAHRMHGWEDRVRVVHDRGDDAGGIESGDCDGFDVEEEHPPQH